MSFACPPSLKKQVDDYASENNVKPSAAVRYIISLFFSTHYDSTEVKSDLTSELSAKITTQHQKVGG
jgi:hypothetical protein